ncbi:MAG: sugar phosphate isomerase/epimerase family protein [Verrucomicrobiota bacterium]|nr:sugar phosphate isomerase/epimerase [Verrucomicrobiota bacterium]MCC6823786.1 sugar phosphate isomerase/epimerase [Limisphaerales bacterium]
MNPHPTPRRMFLKQTAVLSAGLSLTPGLTAAPAAAKPPPFKISLAEWSLHKALFEKKLDHLDFPKAARQDYGIEAIELVNQFFKDKAKNKAYLADFKQRAEGEGVKILLIMCDDEGHLGDADETKRLQAVENHYQWAEAAKFFGCHSIRVNAYSTGTPDEQRDRAADGLRRLAEFGEPLGLNVIVENHGGNSSRGDWLTSVIKQVNRPNCGILPDFGNFQDYDRYQAVAEMMPFAKAVSAKTNDFDAQGNCVETDYHRMLKIVLAAGYHGYLGIEYEGEKLSEPEGIRATKKLLEKVRAELA